MPDKNDWRRQGQENYLKGIKLIPKKYTQYREGWDHDHCEFCSVKFTEKPESESLTEGFTSENNYHWVCKQCYEDFKNEFGW